MKKILYVEDDVLIANVYGQKLMAAGFDVVIAADGLAAVQRLREFIPDLVVLDLLMPKLTGVDVLKFMRQQPELKKTRIIVFSNSFLSNLVEQVARMGVEEALVKASVTPSQLIRIINRTLENSQPAYLSSEAIAAHLAGNVSDGLPQSAGPASASPSQTDSEKSAQKYFVEQSSAIFTSVRKICQEFVDADGSAMQPRKLEDLRRKIGFVSQTLGITGRPQLAQLCNALEAMLFELEERPANITDSIRHTIVTTVALLAEQFDLVTPVNHDGRPALKILVVDDDAVSSRAVVLALSRAKLAASCIHDPFDGLKQLQKNAYDLVLLDVNMPGMDGITLCNQMRGFPLHKKTPVIFVTSQTDFKTRARSVLSGGNDLIAKPIRPTELCVKALSHLLKHG